MITHTHGEVYLMLSVYINIHSRVSLYRHIVIRVTTHLENLEKSGNFEVVREKSGKMEKVRRSEIRCVFSSSNTPKLVFRWGGAPDPAGGAYDAPPNSLVSWGGGHPIPFSQLLQP